jgi:hypothetical protein
MHYESMKHIFNKVDALKCESAATVICEYIVDCMPALKKGFSIHINNSTVAYCSRAGFYPRYFISVDLDTERVVFQRYRDIEQVKGIDKKLCHVLQGSGP